MSVRKPPEKVNVEALINRGAKVKQDVKNKDKNWTVINLRISVEMLDWLDEAVAHTVGVSRTGWILQAIHEKLNKIER